ncbi:MAG TPA: glutamate 5-kinase [Solirubrobacteraceae bacterium]|jgi:glutamate 5-kinase|nr:glutamate 5-kinase [Solirubrobacteraceae bacterium]
MRRVVIKLGSSIVAEETGELRSAVLARICDTVAGLHSAGDEVVVVSSGAIAHGVRIMGLPMRPGAVEELQAASAVGQGKLYRVYDELLRERDLLSAQVLLTFMDMSARTHYLNARQTLRKLLDWRVVPVINENDTTATDEISFGDNDFLAAQVAILTSADLLVLLTDIDGLYTADPRQDPDARLVGEVTDFETLGGAQAGHSTSPLGSGGMRSKVVAADMATAAGIRVVICNGVREGALRAVIDGDTEGTNFPPRTARHSSFKLWLRYAKPSHGTLLIDAGAARALREDGTSLLPVGIVEVQGSFQAGDAVEIAEHASPEGAGARPGAQGGNGTLLGKGICSYSADELRRVKGLKSKAVQEIVPRATEEAVHRDYMVLD